MRWALALISTTLFVAGSRGGVPAHPILSFSGGGTSFPGCFVASQEFLAERPLSPRASRSGALHVQGAFRLRSACNLQGCSERTKHAVFRGLGKG
jgi:hypothetical protein